MQINIGAPGLVEEHPHHFAVDASMIGLKPGDWPSQIETNLGNSMNLVRGQFHKANGDLTHVTYTQAAGCVVVEIFND